MTAECYFDWKEILTTAESREHLALHGLGGLGRMFRQENCEIGKTLRNVISSDIAKKGFLAFFEQAFLCLCF